MAIEDKKNFQTSRLYYLISQKSIECDGIKDLEAIKLAASIIEQIISFEKIPKELINKKTEIEEFLKFFDLDLIQTQKNQYHRFVNEVEIYLYGYFFSDKDNILISPFIYLAFVNPQIKELISKKIISPTNYGLWSYLRELQNISLPERFIASGNSNIVEYRNLEKYKNSALYYNLFRSILLAKNIVDKEDRCIIRNYNKIQFKEYLELEISIIIPVYGSFELLNQCLKSIYRSGLKNYEIICVDDGHPSNTSYDYDIYENIIVVRNNENQGFSLTCNNGIKRAKSDYILLLNSDTLITDGAVESGLLKLKSNSNIALVGSKLLNIDGSLQEAGGVIWSDSRVENFMRSKPIKIPMVEFDRVAGYVSGASMFANKAIWNKLGGFDNKFTPAYYEDTDICVRARSKGYKVYYCHDSEIIHAEGGTNGTNIKSGIKSYQEKNKNKFSLLWKSYNKKAFPAFGDTLGCLANGQKIIVYVDHYIPKIASDAGSKATIHLLDYLIEQGFFVIFWPDNLYPDDENRLVLAKKGVMVIYGSEYINKFGLFIKPIEESIHKIILSRPHISVKYIPHLKGAFVSKTVYLGHDIHYERMKRQNKIKFEDDYIFFADDENIKETRKQEILLWKFCNKVVYFTQRETEIVNKITCDNKGVVIPLFKNINKFSNKNKNKNKRVNGYLFVGGFDHHPNRDGLIWLLNGLEKYQKELIEKLTVVGSRIPEDLKQVLRNKKVTHFENISDVRLDELYNETTVVVAPLRFGSGFKGKVLEAIERGIPVVTTSIGYEGLVLTPEITPFNEIKNFIDHLSQLISSEELRNKISDAQSKMLKNYFSIAKYENIL